MNGHSPEEFRHCQLNRKRSLETTQQSCSERGNSRIRTISKYDLPNGWFSRESSSSAHSHSGRRSYARREAGIDSRHRKVGRRSPQSQVQDSEFEASQRKRALKEARQGNHGLAIAIYDELIGCNPHNASDYNNRGLAHFQSGQYEEAIADYNRAIALNPNLDSVYNNRANYYACRGLLLEAILDYDIAIDLNPGNVRAWINQGITFRELKMYERSIECFDAALTFERLEGNVYAERGRAYQLWGDWNLAVADYIRAIEELPISTSTLYTASGRLRLQVELWLDDLMAPLTEAVE